MDELTCNLTLVQVYPNTIALNFILVQIFQFYVQLIIYCK